MPICPVCRRGSELKLLRTISLILRPILHHSITSTLLMCALFYLFIFGISPCPAIAGDVRGPYLTDLGPKWAQVVFHTEIATDAILQLRGKNGDRQIAPVQLGRERHLFELKDLTPGTRYSYRIEYGNPRAGRALSRH